MGRCSIDLYSNNVGAAFPDIQQFNAYLGGSPLNIAVGASRLGVKAALLTAVGEDQVGDFVLAGLEREKVDTRYIPRKPGTRTPAVLLAILPPDKFPITFYRDNPADTQLSIADVSAAPIEQARALVINGSALAREPSRSATLSAARRAKSAGVTVYLDLDFRADQWPDPMAFGLNVRAVLRDVDVILGTEEEINAALLTNSSQVVVKHSQYTAPEIAGDLEANTTALLAEVGVVIRKEGARGCTVFERGRSPLPVLGFPVEIISVLGAGDAFAGGLIAGRLRGLNWQEAARLGNACGAVVVGEIGCSHFAPTWDEAQAVINRQSIQRPISKENKS
ncbi:5-dehydro-2-deoxygluconokinase [Deinococcus detaillensis]|uniref:5-dehydro-2-deoxygluconokinase n=1 Tax=Deinococcus detaillensis TaxID=2592048 RepID=A0A553UNN3_9DEIO|nr:5-dehydro-2-deoxygluconokinase [Deinococcus detaillensis]